MKKHIIAFLVLVIVIIVGIAGFNYLIDPYCIFRDTYIGGINNIKIHQHTNLRTIIYSNIKMNGRDKEIVFTGNCLLTLFERNMDNAESFTVPMAKVKEVSKIIKNMHKIAPNVRTIYWGLIYDDFLNDIQSEVTDVLPELDSAHYTLQDFINLFFSYNATKHSWETFITSLKYTENGLSPVYVYPFGQIANKKYVEDFPYESIEEIRDVVEYAKEKGINLVFYYSPIHISKKVHMYLNGAWESNIEMKKRLAQITPFLDYSLFNEYNVKPLGPDNYYYIDNIHPVGELNVIAVDDLLAKEKKLGVLINKDNVEKKLSEDTKSLEDFMKKNKEFTETIKYLTPEDGNIKVKRNPN